jgi:transposase InsO family protein
MPGKLNEHTKRTLIDRVASGMPVAEVARQLNVSRQTAHYWVRRFRSLGLAGLAAGDRKPATSPRALPWETVMAILALRVTSGRGPLWIGWQLGLATSTVHRVLQRWHLNRLQLLDRVTRTPVRYEHPAPGDMVHIDVKQLRRIPDGGGRRFDEVSRHLRQGYVSAGLDFVHVAIDDHSRYLYAEILPDQSGATAAAFLRRALAHFRSLGVRVRRVLTDNGRNFQSRAFRQVADQYSVRLKRTRPYRPQTNGKAERVIQTLIREWAYLRQYLHNAERVDALQPFVDAYNTSRPHTALGCRPPISRLPVSTMS